MSTPLPEREQERLAALREYDLLDSVPEKIYDDIVRLAAFICGTPIAAVSLIDSDRQWFKSMQGLGMSQTSRDSAFCAHTILRPEVMIVPDAWNDPRFVANPLVTGDPNIRFYAGAPLVTSTGHALGSLCVIDRVPREMTEEQQEALRILARQVVGQMELARHAAAQAQLLAEREQREIALRESETRFRTSVDAMEEGLALQDAEGAILFCNGSAERILGLSAEQLNGRTSMDPRWRTIREDGSDFPGTEHPAMAAMRDCAPKRNVIMGIHKPTGELTWVNVTAVPLLDEPQENVATSRKAHGVVVTFTDITERRNAEEAVRKIGLALQESQARFEEAQRVAHIGSWEFDVDADTFLWSDELFRLFEVDLTDGPLSVPAVMARYHPDDVEDHMVAALQAMRDGRTFELDTRIVRRDGTLRWAHAVGRGERDATGRVARLYGTLMDIHERKSAEEELRQRAEQLRQSEAALRAVLESAPVILYAANRDGIVTLSEGMGLASLGMKPGDAVGHPVFSFSGGNTVMDDNTRRALNGDAVSYDARVNNQWLHTELRPLRAADGSPNGIIGVCLDVTERMRAEEAARDYAIVLEFQKGELESVNAELAMLASTDGLTGLHNHRAFQGRLSDEAAESVRYGTPLSLILLDCDHFKDYNDAHGHPAGDAMLRMVGQVLQKAARDVDVVARYGGEEFVLILPQTDAAGAAIVAERLRAAVEAFPWPLQHVTASFGVASLRLGEETRADLIARADTALYAAKAAGRNRVVCAPENVVTIK